MSDCGSSCQGCARRDFLRTLGALTGAGALGGAFAAPLPSPVMPAAIPSKVGALKVRVIFSLKLSEEVQTSPDWPNRGFDFRPVMKNMVDALNAGVKDVAFVVGKSSSHEDARRILSEDAKEGDVVGYIVIQLNPWYQTIDEIVKSGKPVLYTALPYAGDGGWLMNDSRIRREGASAYESVCSFDFNHVVGMAAAFAKLRGGTSVDFVAAAKAYRLSITPPESGRKVREDDLRCLSVEETLAKVKGKKLLVLERGWDNAEVAEKDLGLVIECCPFEELNALWEKVSEARAKPLFDEWKRTALNIDGVDDATLMGVARMYFAMDDMIKSHGAVAITINCLGGCYAGKIHAYPCLGFMELQDRGLLGTCESDVFSLITMFVFGTMTGRVGYLSDPVLDAGTRSIVYAHCVSTRKFFGKDGVTSPFEIHTHSEDREGASVRTLAPVGYAMTTVKFDFKARRLAICRGVTTGNDPDDRACRTKIVMEVKGDYEKMSRQWDRFGWHRVSFYGDFAKEAEALAHHLGYEVVWES